MSEFDLVSEYIQNVQKVATLPQLERATEAVVRELGFDYFAILHHPGADSASRDRGTVQFTNYPMSWREVMRNEGLAAVDPVLLASQRAAHGFLWSDVPRMIELTPLQRSIFERAAVAGLGQGYTVPVHVPGECLGSSTFSVRTGKSMRQTSLPMLHYLSGFAFEAGRKLGAAARESRRNGKLTDRQLDCILLAGRGHSARAAAALLGIKQDTFQKHMLEGKQRTGVRTTTQLVVRSLFDGRLTFKDLMPNEKKQRPS